MSEERLQSLLNNEEEKYYSELLLEEGISKEDLELVDLDIAFSPVIPCAGCSPVEAIELQGGNYSVRGYPNTVSPKMLTVMRYRYLIKRR